MCSFLYLSKSIANFDLFWLFTYAWEKSVFSLFIYHTFYSAKEGCVKAVTFLMKDTLLHDFMKCIPAIVPRRFHIAINQCLPISFLNQVTNPWNGWVRLHNLALATKYSCKISMDLRWKNRSSKITDEELGWWYQEQFINCFVFVPLLVYP